MKKKFVLITLAVMTFIVGCKYDDDALWDKVNDLDNRVTSIENTLTKMNSDIRDISTIVNAISNNVYVSSVDETENGYKITFTDGKVVTITNGKDGANGTNGLTPYIGKDGNWWIGDTNTGVAAAGKDGADGEDGKDGADGTNGTNGLTPYIGEDGNWWIGDTNTGVAAAGKDGADGEDGKDGADGKDAPVISIDEFEGKYYWVQIVNGTKTWLTDKNGNKIPVTGADAVTPILRVNASGYWIVSYDHGITFTEILDEYGYPVKAVGEDGESGIPGKDGLDGDSWFEYVNYDPTTGILTLIINGETLQLPCGTSTGIPSDTRAGESPVIQPGEETFVMPTSISAISRDPNNANIGRFNLAGINAGGEWLELLGTGEENQNVWLEINGKPKSVKVINGGEVVTRSRSTSPIAKAKADVVFLVDNSGSMSEEANKVAAEIIRWSQKLSQTMDVRFGCVGIDHNYINGALNITDANTLEAYLNAGGRTGTRRTYHYGEEMETPPVDASALRAAAQNYTNAGGECGGIMLHYADENLTFREGANRFYVYFTDEPNQPGGKAPWSVLTVKDDSEYYNWDASKGVIYTVWSSNYDPHSYTSWLYNEDPTLFSTYTGGQILKTGPEFNVSLDDLPVTGAITQSFIFTFNITGDLTEDGVYNITIIIYYPDGSIKSKYTYSGIRFVAA